MGQQPRKPAGTPVGGQWAPAPHAEADVELCPTTTGPAMAGPVMTQLLDGTREWRQGSKLHRTDGPAVEYASGAREWYQKGRRHRTDGPAVELPDGTREWWVDGKLLRTDNPRE